MQKMIWPLYRPKCKHQRINLIPLVSMRINTRNDILEDNLAFKHLTLQLETTQSGGSSAILVK